ncbi:MAG: mitochondrial escape protein 2, partial [Tremellales sp. Tagirdzhanova-0007]
ELGLGMEPTYETDLGPWKKPASAFLIEENKIESKAVDADLDAESELIRTLPIVVLKNFAQKSARGELWTVLSEWGANLVENRVAHVIVVAEGAMATKTLTKALPSKPLNLVGLADADEANSLGYVREKLTEQSLVSEDSIRIAKLGGRMVDLETLVYKVRSGLTIRDAVDDIVLRNVVELRKLAFGDDAEDAKALPWTRAQAWRVVQDLAKTGEEFPFKGAEQSLKALEEHELVSVTYVEGRASVVRPGKPVFRYAFKQLVDDPVFRASCQIEYNTALIAKAESDIRLYETELATLKDITTNGGDAALGVSEGGFLGLGKSSTIRERSRWLLEKMGKSVDRLAVLERENGDMSKLLGSGSAGSSRA